MKGERPTTTGPKKKSATSRSHGQSWPVKVEERIRIWLAILAANIVKFPHAFILWPSSMSFTMAYPYIVLLVSLCIPTVSVSNSGYLDTPAVRIQQVIVATDTSVFGPEFMSSIAPILEQLPPNLNCYYDNSTQSLDLTNVESSHLLSYRDIPQFSQNLTTIPKLPVKVDPIISSLLNTLFYHPRIRKGMLVDADGLIFTLVEKGDSGESMAHQTWDQIIKSPSHRRRLTPTRHRVQPLSTNLQGKSFLSRMYQSQRTMSLRLGEVILFGAYVLLLVYILLSLSNITSVRSRFGLLLAFGVQCALSVLSACTIISLFVPAFVPRSTHCIVLFPFSVAMIGTGNMFRLVNAVSRTPEENHPFTRLKTALLASAPITIKQVAVDLSIFVIASAASYSHFPHASMVFLASALAVLIDLVLHFTYFLSVLSVDVRRVELEDLISTELPIDRFEEASEDDRRLKLHQRAFVYFHPSFHNIKLPYTTQTTSAVFIVIYVVAILLGLPPSRYGTDSVALFSPELVENLMPQSVDITSPLIVRKYGSSATAAFLYSDGDVLSYLPSMRISFALEFIASLTFILSLTGIILKVILPPEPDAIDEVPVSENQFFAKDLVGHHMLDILQIYTQGSHVLTVSMDRKVLLWNAVSMGSSRGSLVEKPISIPLPRKYWPLHSCELNTSHQLVAMFSKSQSAVIVFNYRIGQVTTCLESPLFRHKPIYAFFRNTDLLVITSSGFLVVVHTSDIDAGTIAATRVPVDMPTKSITAGPGPVPDHLQLDHHTIIWASRINTPRMMERIVIATSANKIFIVSPMRKKWIFRLLDLQEPGSNPPPGPGHMAMRYAGGHMMGKGVTLARQFQLPSDMVELVVLSQLNMLLIGINLEALLVDLQTGTVVKRIHVGHYKRGTLRAFHANPIHCRFCGSTSIESISVSYSDFETPGLVICHTITLDSRSKSNICLRVERDPREIRCLSFEASQEKQHWMSNVEGWETTGINMIMGVSRKHDSTESEEGGSDHELISYNDPIRDKSLFGSSSSPYRTSASIHSRLTAMSSDNKEDLNAVIEKRPPLAVTWEGWVMSASGKVAYYDIPETSTLNRSRKCSEGDDSNHSPPVSLTDRLLIGSVGPVARYGTKSIAVVFGNIIKVLYFGNEESFVDELTPNETASMPGTPLLAPKKWRRVSMNSVNTMN